MNESTDTSSENEEARVGINASLNADTTQSHDADGSATDRSAAGNAEVKETAMKVSWSRAQIMRRIVMPIFAVLAVVAVIVGVLNLTLWRPNRVVTASTSTNSNYVVVNAGVANLVSSNVSATATIRETAAQRESATAGDDNSAKRMMCVVVGSTTDVNAWMRAQAVEYTEITGLSSWSQLSTSTVAKEGQAAKNRVELSESDLWQQSNCAERTATLRVTAAQPNQKIIIYSPSGVASVRLNWNRETIPNTGLPWFMWAIVFAVVAVLAFTWLSGDDPFGAKRRKAKREAQQAAIAARIAAGEDTGLIPGVDTPYVPYQKKSNSGITHRTSPNGVFAKLAKRFSRTNESDMQNSDNASQSADTSAKNSPIVVDPSSVNLVASTGAGNSDSAWSPAVINRSAADSDSQSSDNSSLSGTELLEYLQRLALEDRGIDSRTINKTDNKTDNTTETAQDFAEMATAHDADESVNSENSAATEVADSDSQASSDKEA